MIEKGSLCHEFFCGETFRSLTFCIGIHLVMGSSLKYDTKEYSIFKIINYNKSN